MIVAGIQSVYQRAAELGAFDLILVDKCRADHFLNAVCYEIGVRELICDGFLSKLTSKAGIARADTSRLKLRAGEFIASEVEEVMDDIRLVEAACAEIVEMTKDRQSV